MASERPRATLERLGIARGHTLATTAVVIGAAVVIGSYASWLAADFGLRTPALVVVTLATAYWLYRQRDAWTVLAAGLTLLAVLLVLTPILFNLAFVVDAGEYGVSGVSGFAFTLSDLVFLLVFVVLAAVPAGIGALIRRRR